MRRGWVVLAVLMVSYVGWQLLQWLPFGRSLSGDSLLLTVDLFAVGAAVCASRRAGGSARLRRAWLWVALALLGQAAGGIAAIYNEAAGVSAYPSIADPLYLSFYPLLLVGVLSFPAARRSRSEARELALDCAIVTLGGGMVFVYLILGPNAIAARTPLETITSVAYPAGDMVLLVALCTTLMRGAVPSTLPSLRLMAVAIGSFAVADLIYGYIVLHGVYHGGDPIDTLYALAFACFAAAALRQQTVRSEEPSAAVRSGALGSSWLPYLAIATAIGVLILRDAHRALFPDLSIAIMIALTTAAVIVRQILSQASVKRSGERLAQAQQIAQLGTWNLDLEHNVVELSDAGTTGLEVGTPRMTLEDTLSLIHDGDRERVERVVRTAVRNSEQFECELRIIGSDGETRTFMSRGQPHLRAGRVRAIRGTYLDITDRKRMELQLKHQADHDPLTGLYNRRRFAEELTRVLHEASRYKRRGALLMLDLDDFKLVNDTRGHAAGDTALKVLARAILDRVRSSDVVARLGGDEFAVLLPDAGEQQALAVAEDIRRAVAARSVDAPASITGGIVPFDESWDLVADDAMIAADIALYEAKEAGKNQVQVYRGAARAAVTWVARIRAALQEDRFVLHAQPIIDLSSSEVSHSELLLRMLSEQGELIAPGSFLPSAERFGLINEIDRWVTGRGLALALEGMQLSINLSGQSIGDARILDAVRESVSAGLDPAGVIFEITETAAISNMEETLAFSDALVALGCGLALDDFAAGFGLFSSLKRLPLSHLKIDMRSVREMVANPTDRQVVDSITMIAHGLGIRTIAQGVDDAATLQALRGVGVDLAQGLVVGPPAPLSSARGAGRPAAGEPTRLAV